MHTFTSRFWKFLRFAFGSKAYQFWVLFSPSNLITMHWAALHWDVMLAHMCFFGLRLNLKKSVMKSQKTSFLGVVWNLTTMQATVVSCTCWFVPCCCGHCKARPRLGHSNLGAVGSHGSISQCFSIGSTAHETISVLAQEQRVLFLGLPVKKYALRAIYPTHLSWHNMALWKLGWCFQHWNTSSHTWWATMCCCSFFRQAQQNLLWAETKLLSQRAVYIPGHVNILACFCCDRQCRWR